MADLGLIVDRGTEGDALGRAHALGSRYEGMLAGRAGGAGARRRAGAYYTPVAIAAALAERALTPLLDEAERAGGAEGLLGLRVCDPACGAGRFLIVAAELIAKRVARARAAGAPGDIARARREVVTTCVFGSDIDAAAVEVCRDSLAEYAGLARSSEGTLRKSVRGADSLLEAPGEAFDAVIGNPPFLNQLQTRTARTRGAHAALAGRFPGAVRPYTDAAAMFLLASLERARPGGVVALIQPQSVLASRDARGVRGAVLERAAIEGVWLARERVFEAGVHVFAIVLRAGAPQGAVRRWVGAAFEPLPDADRGEVSAESWAPLVAEAFGVPRGRTRTDGVLGDLASATADFRDQFYGLRGCIVEDGSFGEGERSAKVVTTGLIDPGRCAWGERACRLLGETWMRPRADLAALERAGLGAWASARLVPKLLLATQTRVLEMAVDAEGRLLPVTPLISIVPRDPRDTWRLAAAIMSPPATAWAVRQYAGTGLSATAIKLSARQVLGLPLPRARGEWDEAARLLRDGGAVEEVGRLMCGAYGLGAPEGRDMMAWWAVRLKPRRSRVPQHAPIT